MSLRPGSDPWPNLASLVSTPPTRPELADMFDAAAARHAARLLEGAVA